MDRNKLTDGELALVNLMQHAAKAHEAICTGMTHMDVEDTAHEHLDRDFMRGIQELRRLHPELSAVAKARRATAKS